MLSLEQLSQVVNEHLRLCNESVQCPSKWIVSKSPLGGRGLIATTDIMPGEVLFVDHPLIYGPRSAVVVPRGCTVCYKIDDDCIKCSVCSLLLCSGRCHVSDTHYKDCALISRWGTKVPIEEVDDALLSRTLTPIRALLLDETRKQLMVSLEAHQLPQHGSEVRELTKYFEIPEEELQVLTLACCVLDANAFQIATAYGKQEEMSLRGLYPVSGLMNHNCVPNTRHSFNNDRQMTVRAVKPIAAGSEIFTCYAGMLWGTPVRRTHLYKTKHFMCVCDRCSDPTERGTMLAALKCFSPECPGSLLPIEPLMMSSAWRCLECNMQVPAKHIGAIQSALGSLMGSLNFENPIELENFLLHRVTKYIPKTNQIVLDLQCSLIWIIGDTEGLWWHELEPSRLDLKETLCRSTLRTVAALGVGDAHLRGLLLYHLHAALAERARRDPVLYEDLKCEIETTIEQAYHILHGDISAPPDLELRRQYLGPDSNKSYQDRLFILNSN